ncbi:MAG: ECF transporter S component [Theionarchaea archaeon]|nr:ECF transporter S component [Theionarchaea archaeon]
MTTCSAKRIALMGIFAALSLAGSFIKIPSPIGSPALDSAPGYFSAVAFGTMEGCIVAILGHLLTSMNAGFPLGMLHVLIALGMGICAVLFRSIYQKLNILLACISTILLNGIVLPLLVIPFYGVGFYWILLPSIFLASILNICIAGFIYIKIKDKIIITT